MCHYRKVGTKKDLLCVIDEKKVRLAFPISLSHVQTTLKTERFSENTKQIYIWSRKLILNGEKKKKMAATKVNMKMVFQPLLPFFVSRGRKKS